MAIYSACRSHLVFRNSASGKRCCCAGQWKRHAWQQRELHAALGNDPELPRQQQGLSLGCWSACCGRPVAGSTV
eukprot:3387174-Alexandrium_andersonii.AAC.1